MVLCGSRPDDRSLVFVGSAGSEDGRVYLWDTERHEPHCMGHISFRGPPVCCVSWSPWLHCLAICTFTPMAPIQASAMLQSLVPIHPSVYLSACLPVHPSLCLPVHPFGHPSLCLSVHVSIQHPLRTPLSPLISCTSPSPLPLPFRWGQGVSTTQTC